MKKLITLLAVCLTFGVANAQLAKSDVGISFSGAGVRWTVATPIKHIKGKVWGETVLVYANRADANELGAGLGLKYSTKVPETDIRLNAGIFANVNVVDLSFSHLPFDWGARFGVAFKL